MDAVQADFDLLQNTGGYVDVQWPPLAKILRDLGAAWNMVEQTGDAPDGHATGVILGAAGAGNYKKVRLTYDGTSVILQTNSGSDAVPSWDNLLAINCTTDLATFAGAVTIAGALTGVGAMTMSGALNLGGNNITNVGTIACTTINGVSPASHGTRHSPDGTDAVAVETVILDVGAAASAGAASNVARGDHVHRGVTKVKKSGGSDRYGTITLANGDFITVTDTAGTFDWDYVPPNRVYQEESGDIVLAVTTPANFTEITALDITGADSSKKYRISFVVVGYGSVGADDIAIRLHVGANGNNSDAIEAEFPLQIHAASDYQTLAVAGYEVTPTAGHKVGLSAYSVSGSTIKASGNFKTFLEIVEIQE